MKYRAENWSFHLGSERVQGTWTLRNSVEKINRCQKDHLSTLTYVFWGNFPMCQAEHWSQSASPVWGKEFVSTLRQLKCLSKQEWSVISNWCLLLFQTKSNLGFWKLILPHFLRLTVGWFGCIQLCFKSYGSMEDIVIQRSCSLTT